MGDTDYFHTNTFEYRFTERPMQQRWQANTKTVENDTQIKKILK